MIFYFILNNTLNNREEEYKECFVWQP